MFASSKSAVLSGDCFLSDGTPIKLAVLKEIPADNIGVFSGRFHDDAQRSFAEHLAFHALPSTVKATICVGSDSAEELTSVAEERLVSGAHLLFDDDNAPDRRYKRFSVEGGGNFKIVCDPYKRRCWMSELPSELIAPLLSMKTVNILYGDCFLKLPERFRQSISDDVAKMDINQTVEEFTYGNLVFPFTDEESDVSAFSSIALEALPSSAENDAMKPYAGFLKIMEDLAGLWVSYVSEAVKNETLNASGLGSTGQQRRLIAVGDLVGMESAIDAYFSGVPADCLQIA